MCEVSLTSLMVFALNITQTFVRELLCRVSTAGWKSAAPNKLWLNVKGCQTSGLLTYSKSRAVKGAFLNIGSG